MPARIVRNFSVFLIALGMVVSIYLLVRTFSLAEEVDGVADVCSAIFGPSCDATLRSPMAHQAGIPLAGWGVVWFGGLATVLAVGWWLGPAFAADAFLAAAVVSIPIAFISMLLTAAMLVGFAPLCPLCMIVHSVNSVLPIVLSCGAGPVRQWSARFHGAIRFAFGRDADDSVAGKWKAVGFFASALAALAIYQAVMIQESLQRDRLRGESLPLATLLDFERAQIHPIPIDGSPQTGAAEGGLTLVIFSDFRCPSCRRFAATLAELQYEFSAKLTIVFKHYPLESTCNPAVKSERHPGACRFASAAEAAHQQNRFWQMHDLLFRMRDLPSDEQLATVATASGMDSQAFEADRQSDELMSRIQADVKLGQSLGVEATPTIFLAGKRVNDLRVETLRGLIALQIERAVPKSLSVDGDVIQIGDVELVFVVTPPTAVH
ncbi:MAG: thioredoxin domain-containing protein [Planctomycetaceae bacterium]